MSLRLVLLAGVLAGGLAACDILDPDTERERLEEAQERWADRGIDDYRIDVQRLCFCAADVSRWVRVTVRNGVVASRTYVDDGTPVVGDPTLFPDVDGLFEVIDDALDQDAHELEVAYDPVYGIPLVIAIDYLEFAVDEELTLRSQDFQLLDGGGGSGPQPVL